MSFEIQQWRKEAEFQFSALKRESLAGILTTG